MLRDPSGYAQAVTAACQTAAPRRGRLTVPIGLQSAVPHIGQRGNGGGVAI